ncbi:MAG: Gfo/Idh/MocA family oxidoreductase [Gemmatimonadetes bacterium]|nr:Gfo/Idh/MocA family oxidoreductase [Gemmatimonadota bacterium]
MSNLTVAVIGLRGHAARHIEMVRQTPGVTLDRVYYHKIPPPDQKHLPITNTLSDCLDSDVIIISSPTPRHAEQLQMLRHYRGYVLLEKPAAVDKGGIDVLLDLPAELKSRTQVNFNFLFHDVAAHLRELAKSPVIGDVFAFEVHTSHGGAFRDDWRDSWRLSGEPNFGPLETVGIHFIHFALVLFGRCENALVRSNSLSGRSDAVDTGMLAMRMENGVSVNISNSYAAPYVVRMALWGTNGHLVYDGETATLYSPRDTFDERGMFSSPPAVESWSIDYPSAWASSLASSQRHFFKTAQQRVRLDPGIFDRDVAAMNVLLDAESTY